MAPPQSKKRKQLNHSTDNQNHVEIKKRKIEESFKQPKLKKSEHMDVNKGTRRNIASSRFNSSNNIKTSSFASRSANNMKGNTSQSNNSSFMSLNSSKVDIKPCGAPTQVSINDKYLMRAEPKV